MKGLTLSESGRRSQLIYISEERKHPGKGLVEGGGMGGKGGLEENLRRED